MSSRVVVSIIREVKGRVLLEPWFGPQSLLIFEYIIHSNIGVSFCIFFGLFSVGLFIIDFLLPCNLNVY